MIVCSCRKISDKEISKDELFEIMLDPETIKCGKCIRHLKMISTHDTLASKLRKLSSMHYEAQRRIELDALVGNVYDKSNISVELYSADRKAGHNTWNYWGSGFSKYTQGIAILYGETELMRIRFQELKESSPELYRYWLNREIES